MGLAVIQEFYADQRIPAEDPKSRNGICQHSSLRGGAGGDHLVLYRCFSSASIVIYSGSMRPAFDAGDIVIVAKKSRLF